MAFAITLSNQGATIWSARILAFLWTGFWLFFAVASGIVEGGGLANFLKHALLGPPAILFLAVSVLAWRRPKWGGLAFIALGVVLSVTYPILAHRIEALVVTLLAVAPLVTGLLFLQGSRGRRT